MSAHSHVQRMQMLNRMEKSGGAPASVLSGGGDSVLSGGSYVRNQQQQRYNPYQREESVLMVGGEESRGGGGSVLSGGSAARPAASYRAETGRYHPSNLSGAHPAHTHSQAALPASMRRAQSQSSLGGAASGSRLKGASSQTSLGPRSFSRTSLAHMSRSLGASKASMASLKSGKTTIQQEFHDFKVKRRLASIRAGKARLPFCLAVCMFVCAAASLALGLCITILRAFGQIFLSLDRGEIVGPLFIALTVVFLVAGVKFVRDAHRTAEKQRERLKFRAAECNMIGVTATAQATAHTRSGHAPSQTARLVSGTQSKRALHRVPQAAPPSSASMYDYAAVLPGSSV